MSWGFTLFRIRRGIVAHLTLCYKLHTFWRIHHFFRDVRYCSLVKSNWLFERNYWFHLQNRNVEQISTKLHGVTFQKTAGILHGHHRRDLKIFYYTFSRTLHSFVRLIHGDQHSPGLCFRRTSPDGDSKANIIKLCFRNLAMLTWCCV